MSLSTIRTRVDNNIQSNSGITDAQINQWINDTQRRICRVHTFYWLESQATLPTTDEQAEYSLPTAGDSSWTDTDSGTVKRYKEEIACHLLDYQNRRVPLERVYKRDADDKWEYRDQDDKGQPHHYSVQRSKLKLYKKPDHTSNNSTAWSIILDYFGFLADFSADGDTNFLETNYPEALEYGATSLAYRYLFEEQKADYYEQKLRDIIQEMVRESNQYQHAMIEEGMEPQDGCGVADREYRYHIRAHYE